MRIIRLKSIVALIVLAIGSVWAIFALQPEPPIDAYAVLNEDLEPFISDFNSASDGVRAVLLVGPT